jgi:vancomycin permeability regulator SanA
MSRNPIVTFAQDRLDAARREIKAAVIDFDVSDEKLLELRANARAAYEELRAMDAKLLKKGILSLFKFW